MSRARVWLSAPAQTSSSTSSSNVRASRYRTNICPVSPAPGWPACTARLATLYGSPVSAMRWRAAVFLALF